MEMSNTTKAKLVRKLGGGITRRGVLAGTGAAAAVLAARNIIRAPGRR
jgi:hypothetical protein